MSTVSIVILAVGASSLALWGLALRDPKRVRSLARRGHRVAAPLAPLQRRLLTLLALLPGVALCITGAWAAFLMWMGSLTVGGWLMANLLAWKSQSGRMPMTEEAS